jgi:hypothetical protein
MLLPAPVTRITFPSMVMSRGARAPRGNGMILSAEALLYRAGAFPAIARIATRRIKCDRTPRCLAHLLSKVWRRCTVLLFRIRNRLRSFGRFSACRSARHLIYLDGGFKSWP